MSAFNTEGRPPKIIRTERIPLVGGHNTRPATAGAFLDKDQRFINFLPMKVENPITEKKTFYAIKRPGFESSSTPATGNIGTALHVWETVGTGTTTLSAFGATNSTIYQNTTSLGAITGRARGFSETDSTGTSTILIPSTDSTLWYYPTAGSLTQVTDVDYPGNAGRTTVGKTVHMDGYTFQMDSTGRVYNSDLNSITAWTSTAFTAPTFYTGNGVGLARHHDAIAAFSTSSIEFYYNAGSSPSPLSRREIIVTAVGGVVPASHGDTIVQNKDTITFLGMSRAGASGVYMLKRFAVAKISTQPIDAQIEVAEPQNCTLTTARFWGKDFVILVAGTVTFIYNMDDEIWSELSGDAVLWNICAGSAIGDGKVFSVSTSDTGGKIFEINTDTPVYTDNGAAYTATIQTSLIDFGTQKYKRYHAIRLIGDKQTSTATVAISWSDNDYGSFSTARNVDMSSARAYLTQCGIARRRSIKLTNSTNTPLRLEALELDFSEMDK